MLTEHVLVTQGRITGFEVMLRFGRAAVPASRLLEILYLGGHVGYAAQEEIDFGHDRRFDTRVIECSYFSLNRLKSGREVIKLWDFDNYEPLSGG